MTRVARVVAAWVGLGLGLGLGLLGCDNDLPEPDDGGTVRGTVTYDGDAQSDLIEPAVRVVAVYTFPPTDLEAMPPHGLVQIENPDLSAPLPYELRHLAPGPYYILGQLFDMQDPDSLTTPAGAYPDFCVPFQVDGGNVEVQPDAAVDGIDITLYDAAGQTDPCTAASAEVCPAAGAATLDFEVRSASEVGADDILVVALFASNPPTGAPTRFKLFTPGQFSFPHRVLDNAVPPGDHVVAVCHDRGGDDVLGGGCGEEDASLVWNDGEAIAMDADMIYRTGVDLDTAASDELMTNTPADFFCPEP
jgi:hypothetical protein